MGVLKQPGPMLPVNGISLVVLDFDGTLVDTRDDIITGVNQALGDLGMPQRPGPQIAGFIGRGVEKLAAQSLPPDRGDLLEAMLDRFRYRYERCFDHTARPYPGVDSGLALMQEMGLTMAVASNKPSFYLQRLLEQFDLHPYFCIALGGDQMEIKKPHPWCIEQIWKECGGTPGTTLMVGDMRYDIETGINAGARTCGVRYGYGTAAELLEAGAGHLVDEFPDLPGLLG